MVSLEIDQTKKLVASPVEGCRSKFGPKKVRDEQQFGCPEAGCQKRFSFKTNMDCHVRLFHRKERPFPCSSVSCKKNFGSKKDMERHVSIVHNGIRPFVCPSSGCKESFGRKHEVAIHLRVAHGHPKLVCGVGGCTSQFMSACGLNRHKKKSHKVRG